MELKDAIELSIRVAKSANARFTVLDIACLVEKLKEEFEGTHFSYIIESKGRTVEGRMYFKNESLGFAGSVGII